jgi:hypothetical protein
MVQSISSRPLTDHFRLRLWARGVAGTNLGYRASLLAHMGHGLNKTREETAAQEISCAILIDL